jgi:hypothetical protein
MARAGSGENDGRSKLMTAQQALDKILGDVARIERDKRAEYELLGKGATIEEWDADLCAPDPKGKSEGCPIPDAMCG